MQRALAGIGAVALAVWTLGGAVAWWQAKERFTLVVQEGAPAAAEDEARVALLEERLNALATDVRALTGVLERNFGVLDERAEERARESRERVEAELARLREELGAVAELGPRIDAMRASVESERRAVLARTVADEVPPPVTASLQEPAQERAIVEEVAGPDPDEAPADPPPRASFLAFRLPSDDFRFDERRTWTVVPALSRVGFDAKSTLHDFSGVSSEVEGSLSAELARPGSGPAARVSAKVASLATGEQGRDAGMRESLSADVHPELEFVLVAFEPRQVDEAAGLVAGQARGHMRIRGVERELSMPVRMELDEAHRLSIDGEVELDLPDYGVPVPSKLGLIRMQETVRVWIALRARLEPRGGA